MRGFSAISLFFATCSAFRLPFRRADPAHSTNVIITPSNSSNLGFTHADNVEYTATIYVNGVPFQVVIDTGSADLWIDPDGVDVPGLVYTGVNTTVQYVDGSSSPGMINAVNITLGEFTVENQAIILSPGSTATNPGRWNGLIGVGSPYQSQVLSALLQANSSYKGWPFLDNVFSFYPNESNYMTFLLSRSEIGITNGGVFTIAELDSDHANVTQAPILNVFTNGGWTTFMDGVRINGELFTGNSVIAPNYTAIGVEVPGNSTIVTLDTGTSYALAPPYYVDALYKNLPGAVFADNVAGTGFGGYYLPCNTKINVSLVLGGQDYPIHPVDVVAVNFAHDGTFNCTGAFGYGSNRLVQDFLMGDIFLRNVYSLFDFGNWTAVGEGVPFMQLLSVTDADTAWAEADAINLARLLQLENYYQTTVTNTVSPTGGSAFSSPTTTSVSASTTGTGSVSTSSITTPTDATASTGSTTTATSTPPPGPTTTDIFRAGGALAAVSTDASGDIDFSGLTRNTYIIMGLLGGVLVLLIVVAVLVARAAKANAGYKAVPNISVQPPAFNKPYESYSESYATPYSDGGH